MSFHEKTNRGVIFGPKIIIFGPLSGYKVYFPKPDLTEYLHEYVYIQPNVSDLWVRLTAKPLMILPSSGWIYAFSKSTFHERSTGLIRCFTTRDWFKNWVWFFGILLTSGEERGSRDKLINWQKMYFFRFNLIVE